MISMQISSMQEKFKRAGTFRESSAGSVQNILLEMKLQISAVPVSVNRSFERECVKFFREIVQLFELPPSVGEIYGLLFASPTPLSFSDIVEQLKISKGSASQGLHILRTVGAVNVLGGCNARREYFEPELSLRQLVSGILRERIVPIAAAGGNRLERLRELADTDDATNGFYLDRVGQLETWRRRLRVVLPVLTALLGPKKKR